MAEIFFVEDGNSAVIDSWISDTKVVADPKVNSASSSINTAGKQKAGLGFTEQPKVQNKSEDVLKQKLQNKRKFDNNNTHLANHDSAALHGIVEDVEESRTTIAPTKKQKQAGANASASTVEKKKAPHNAPPKAKKENAVVAATKGPISNVEKVDNNYFSASNAPAVATDGSTEGAAHVKESFTAMARKKGKTRSKQKNIRRDNRADSSKPAHLLDVRSKDYKGRPLTQETKAILNLKSGKSSDDNSGNKNNNNRQQQQQPQPQGQRQRQKEKMNNSNNSNSNKNNNNNNNKKKEVGDGDSSNNRDNKRVSNTDSSK